MTSTIASMSDDLNKSDEPMTLADYVDEWSRMTPRQRDFVLVMFATAARTNGVYCSSVLTDYMGEPITPEYYELWDKMDMPFKFGGNHD